MIEPSLRSSLHLTEKWHEFVAQTDRAICEVLIVPDVSAWSLWESFVAHQRRYDLTPRILVTTPSPQNLRHTIAVILHDLIWLDPGGTVDLTESVARALAQGLLQQCSNRFARADTLEPALRTALAGCPFAVPAVRQVNELVAIGGLNRKTASASWTRFVGPAPAIRLKPVLDLILLVRAAYLRQRGMRWPKVASELGLRVDLLRQTSKSRVGATLSEVSLSTGIAIVRELGLLLDGRPVEWPLELPLDEERDRAIRAS